MRQPYQYEMRLVKGWCGPATLHMGLLALGINVSQEQLAKDADYHEEWGTENADMLATAKIYVPNSYVIIGKSLEDLNKIGQHDVVIVQFVDSEPTSTADGDDSHYVLLNGLTKDKVLVVDPNPISPVDGGFREIKRDWFETHFWDEDKRGGITKGWALVIPLNK